MSDFRLTQINNVMLGTTDLARSLAFYRDTLGLAVQFEILGFVFLNAGGVTLSLSTTHKKLATAGRRRHRDRVRCARSHRGARTAEGARRRVSQRAPQRHRRPVGGQFPGP